MNFDNFMKCISDLSYSGMFTKEYDTDNFKTLTEMFNETLKKSESNRVSLPETPKNDKENRAITTCNHPIQIIKF